MLLDFIKNAIKSALHQATEEWAEEFGLDPTLVRELRRQREQFIAQRQARKIEAADAAAIAALNVEEEEAVDSGVPAMLSLPAPTTLGVDGAVQSEAPPEQPAPLPMPSAARDTGSAQATDEEPTAPPTQDTPLQPEADPAKLPEQPPADDNALMDWVDQQRQAHVSWSALAEAVARAGHDLSEEALRGRYRRWREKNGHNGQD